MEQKYEFDALRVSGQIWEECCDYDDAKFLVEDVNDKLKQIFLFRDLYEVNLVTTVYHDKNRGTFNLRMYCRDDMDTVYDGSDVLNIYIKMGIYPANYVDTLKKAAEALALYYTAITNKFVGDVNDTHAQEILKNMEVVEDFDDEEGGALF